MNSLHLLCVSFACVIFLSQCKKESTGTTPIDNGQGSVDKALSYGGDGVFYLSADSKTVAPVSRTNGGKFRAIPDNLQIDSKTGEIKLQVEGTDGRSQTGIWYKVIQEKGNSGKNDTATVMISGLNYIDRFYELKKNETVISPIYNADPSAAIPQGDFEIRESKYTSAINRNSGQIDINKLMAVMQTETGGDSTWKYITVDYTLNDRSKMTKNSIMLVVYYYHKTKDETPSNVTDLMQAHRNLTFGMDLQPLGTTVGTPERNLPSVFPSNAASRAFKPRPPCVVIVGI